jgi:hypothetical protein
MPDLSFLSAVAFHPKIEWAATGAFVENTSRVDLEFVRRIRSAYRLSSANFSPNENSMWKGIHQKSDDVHEALMGEDEDHLQKLLSDPGQTNLFCGMDELCREEQQNMRKGTAKDFEVTLRRFCDGLIRLGEATGAVRLWNPEGGGTQYSGYLQGEWTGHIDIESTLAAIEKKIGTSIEFPNPFAGQYGIQTSRGIASYRPFQAIYQAWRLQVLARFFGAKVLEIGGGLGRTVYYAHRFGLTDYTSVDLPLTGVAQALFLGQTLGPKTISLAGEKYRAGQVRLAPTSWLLNGTERFDIVLNVDSMTEMAKADAIAYAEAIVRRSKVLLSINHEVNLDKVQDLAPLARLPMMRSPYWMRKGYAEEVFVTGAAEAFAADFSSGNAQGGFIFPFA